MGWSWTALVACTAGLVFALPVLAADAVFTPVEARELLGKECTVEMEVQSTGFDPKPNLIFLNSERSYQSKNNLTVVLDEKLVAELRSCGIEDPRKYYSQKSLQITGTIVEFKGRRQLRPARSDEIKVLKQNVPDPPDDSVISTPPPYFPLPLVIVAFVLSSAIGAALLYFLRKRKG